MDDSLTHQLIAMSAVPQSLLTEEITIQSPPPGVRPLEKLLTGIGLTLAIGLLAATLPANSALPPLVQPLVQIN
jgi:hypothetical protein